MSAAVRRQHGGLVDHLQTRPSGCVERTATGTATETDWDAGLRDLDKDLDGTLDDDGPTEQPPA